MTEIDDKAWQAFRENQRICEQIRDEMRAEKAAEEAREAARRPAGPAPPVNGEVAFTRSLKHFNDTEPGWISLDIGVPRS